MQKYTETVLDSDGEPLASASVTIQVNPLGAAATIYSDNGVTPVTNPLTTNATGVFQFYAADGRYDATITKTGYVTSQILDILLDDPTQGVLPISQGGTGSTTSNAALTALTATRSETGAVAVPVLTKLRETVSVKDFGAVGDGVVNDTAAFTAAGSGATTLEVHIYAGTYLLSTSPTPTGAVTWVLHSGATTTGAGVLPGRIVKYGAGESLISALHNKSVATVAGEAPGLKVGVGSGTEPGWTSNPAAGDFLTLYSYISSSAVRNRVWALNGIVDIPSGSPATAWAIEGNVNVGTANTPDPRTTDHAIGIDMVSGGTFAPSAAFASNSSSSANRWKHGIWLGQIGGQTNSTLIKAGTGVTVDFGLDISAATVNFQGVRIGATTAGQVAPIGIRQFANAGVGIFLQRFTDTAPTGNLMQVVNAANSVILASIDASGNLTCGNITSALITNGGATLGIGDNSADIQWRKALVALGGGAAPTLGTIGGSGPTAAAQNSWMRVIDSAGAVFWVPVWK